MTKVTIPLPDTHDSLFRDAINVLRIAGHERIADDLDDRMEKLLCSETKPTIAIYVKGGMVQAVRSNISPELEVEIVDCNEENPEDRWDQIETQLDFGNY